MAPRKSRKSKRALRDEEEEEEIEQQEVLVDDPVDVVYEKQVMPGFYLDVEELEGIQGNLLDNLAELGWLQLAKFSCNWYYEIVSQFYENAQFENRSVKFIVNGIEGVLTEVDLNIAFGLPLNNLEQDLPSLDIPARKWSSNWPLGIVDCSNLLNNGRDDRTPLGAVVKANRLNLTGSQKLALKLVNDCFIPTNNKDSRLSYIQSFLTAAIMTRCQLNLPSLIISHMKSSQSKDVLPYGMLISHVLTMLKGVDASMFEARSVPDTARIGKLSLKSQELYIWQGRLYSKWEVFEYFEVDLLKIWEENKCAAPCAPPGWIARGGNIDPPGERSIVLASSSRGQHSGAGGTSSGGMTDREMLEQIYAKQNLMEAEQRRMVADQHAFITDYRDYQWRQTAMLQAMCGQMNLGDDFTSLFGGFPTTGPAPPSDTMDDDQD